MDESILVPALYDDSNQTILYSFNKDGVPNMSFGVNGELKLNKVLTSGGFEPRVMVLSNDDFVVWTKEGNNPNPFLKKFTKSGQAVTNFGTAGIVDSIGPVVTITSNDEMIAERTIGASSGYVKLNSNGTIATSFGSNGVMEKNALPFDSWSLVQFCLPESYLGVGYTQAGGVGSSYLFKVNNTGVLDNNFGQNGMALMDTGAYATFSIGNIHIMKNGKIVFTGSGFHQINDEEVKVYRYHSNGVIDSSFNGNGKLIFDLKASTDNGRMSIVQPDNKIITMGYAKDFFTGYWSVFIVRINEDGSFDQTFGDSGIVNHEFISGYNSISSSMLLHEANTIIVNGTCDSSQYKKIGISRFHLGNISGIENNSYSNSSSIHPNPSNGNFTVDFNEHLKGEYSIIDLIGKVVYSGTFHGKVINVETHIPPGVYVLRISTDNSTFAKKIIIE